MRLRITHTTTFTYDKPISEAHTEVRMKPIDGYGQRCVSFTLSVEPQSDVFHYADLRGNDVRYFEVLPPHDRLVVTASSEVITPESFTEDQRGLSPLELHDYTADTVYTPISEAVRRLVAPLEIKDDPEATALALMQAVNGALQYERDVTHVRTTAHEALEAGRGVCQDFVHVMLAACRALKLPARYVSGYLKPRRANPEIQATHAWVDVFLPVRGWVSLDPTHNTPQTADYVRMAVGRDYADVTPTRGVYTGNAVETMEVAVSVQTV